MHFSSTVEKLREFKLAAPSNCNERAISVYRVQVFVYTSLFRLASAVS
jgi:hypothetical protein